MKSEYVFFNGERIARRDFPSGSVAYYFSDHLKTASVITDATGNIKSESDYYPWGGEFQLVANDSNHYKFTGKERDTETGLDYFGARYYSNGLGRWISADWSPTPIPVPYADLSDPQTLNLYGYVRNIPTSRADADGHCGPLCGAAIGFVAGAAVSAGVQFVKTGHVDLKKVGLAAAGGAIIGATGGAASESGMPLLLQGITVGSAGMATGVAERAVETGSMDKATENPAQIVTDGVVAGTLHVGGELVQGAMVSRSGAPAEVAARAAKLEKAQTAHASRVRVEKLAKASEKLEHVEQKAEAKVAIGQEVVSDLVKVKAKADRDSAGAPRPYSSQ